MSEQKRSDKDHRKQITPEQVKDARLLVKRCLFKRLEEKDYGTWTSRHEILGFLTEEYYETVEAIHSKSLDEMESELVDVAVGCIFAIACKRSGGLDW